MNKIFIARSKDKKIFLKSSSGGIITTLLVYLFDQGKINMAVVTGWDDRKKEPYSTIIKSSKEAISFAKSKYLKSNNAKDIIKTVNSGKKFAIVGTPCHIKMAKKIIDVKGLDKEDYFLFGVFCNHPVTVSALEFLADKYGKDFKKIENVSFRGEDTWDSSIRMEFEDGCKFKVPVIDTWGGLWGPGFFTPRSCLACSDHTSEFADISVGDAWETGQLQKTALVIARNKKGLRVLEDMEQRDFIWLEQARKEDLELGHKHNILFKKARAAVALKDKSIYDYGFIDIIFANIFGFFSRISEKKSSWFFIRRMSRVSRWISILISAYYRRRKRKDII